MMVMLIILSACQEKPRTSAAFVDLGGQVTDEPEPEPEPEEVVRPTGVIFFKNDFCACNNQKSVIISGSTCANFCATKATGGLDNLYFNFTVGDEIISQGFGDVSGWCKAILPDGKNPQCVLEARSEAGAEAPITFPITSGNSFTANISTLAKDKTYIITLTELTSGAKSNSIQLRKLSDGPGNTQLGPLVVQPVTQYTCINRRILEDTNNGDTFYEYAVRLHFYFIEKFRPERVPSGISDVFCHDVNLHPGPDKNTYPRLEETPGAYALWSSDDIRFFDLDVPASGQRDVNELIAKKAKDYGTTLTATPNLFFELTMSSGPTINQVGNVASSGAALGFYMSYLNDTAAGNVAYCPKQAHYNAGDNTIRAIGDVIQADTEGIYLAKRETETFTNSSGETECLPMDIIVTRETDMKRVWFFLHPTTRVPTQPVSASSLRNNTIKFYYPYDFTTPYVKKSYQKEYTVILPNQVSQGTCSDSSGGGTPTPAAGGIPTTYTPHDRRFGCIPVSSTP
jgi:hypothetical protein